ALEAVKWLHRQGADLNKPNKKGFYPLHVAAKYNHVNVLLYLLTLGISIEQPIQDEWGETACHRASAFGALDAVKLLHQQGADLNKPNKKGFYPLHLAAQYNHINVLSHLLTLGILIEQPTQNEWGETACHRACRAGALDAVKLLHQQGADLNKP